MNTFIQNLMIINIGIALVIAAFILLRYMLKSKVHTSILCILWFVIFVRMLVPIPIESNFGIVDNDVAQNALIQAENFIMNSDDTNNLVGIETSDIADDIQPAENTITNNNAELSMTTKSVNISVLMYAVGAAAAALYIALSNLIFSKKIRRDRIKFELSDDDKQVFKDQRIQPLKVFLVENLHSPCLIGLIRPRILLNSKSAENERIRRYSLYHETTHYKHKDNLILLIGLIACIINWFNPMMWLALSLSKRDREVLCDEQVIKKIGSDEIVDYGKSLLYVAQNKPSRLLSLPTTMTGGKREMKQRIKNLTVNPKRWIVISILVVIVVVSLIACAGLKKSPETEVIGNNEIEKIINPDEYPELLALFKPTISPSTDIWQIYRTDIDKDGVDELYANSGRPINAENSTELIECYDYKTDTYSYLKGDDGRDYKIIVYENNLYIFELYNHYKSSDELFSVHKLVLINGEVSYDTLDNEKEQEVIDYIFNNISVGLLGQADGPSAILTFEDITDISIYDISSGEDILLNKYTQEDSEIIKQYMPLYRQCEFIDDEQIEQSYKAVINLDQDGIRHMDVILFGEDEYIQVYTGRTKNDNMLSFLRQLADGSYSSGTN